MCTAISMKDENHYFGRTLDVDRPYGEGVVICPSDYEINFRKSGALKSHYAMIGVGIEQAGHPLYFDAVNEKGLAIAGLNFPDNACYYSEVNNFSNIAPFELIPWILGQCDNVDSARSLVLKTNIVDIPFSSNLPLTPLHWMISDKNSSIVVETLKIGMKIHQNPVGVLTNNPPFETMTFLLDQYRTLSPKILENTFSSKIDLNVYSEGMGGIGLPGDYSSPSRFVRAAFLKLNSVCSDECAVAQLFHLLESVAQLRGSVVTKAGRYEYTAYTNCYDTKKGRLYVKTYDGMQTYYVDISSAQSKKKLTFFPLIHRMNALKLSEML